MPNPEPAREVVEVIQADRDAAAYIHAAQYGSATPGYGWILSGEQDDDVLVQTLAAHRISALKGQPAASGWKPIETAPKDGTAVLAWCVHPYASSMTEPAEYVGPVVTHWIDHNGGGWTWHGHLGNFTHWQPLPAAPELGR